MKKLLSLLCIVGAFWACQRSLQPIAPPFEPDYALDRFESTIKTYEQDDTKNGISKGGILFFGSSSWYFWKNIKQDLSPLPVINRGFGGSTIPELTHYARRMVFPYAPKIVVVYGGENDLAGQKPKSPEQVLDSYKAFVAVVRQALPQTKFYYVSMKKSPSRRNLWDKIEKGNELIAAFSKQKNMGYININPLIFNDKGLPKAELYTQDSLHINTEGYRAYAELIRPILQKAYR